MVLQNSGRYQASKNDKSTAPGKSGAQGPEREETSEFRLRLSIENEAIDVKYGFERVKDNKERTGFLLNMHSTEILDDDKRLVSAVDFYFIEEDGTRFKVSYPFMPYFYILTKREHINEISQFLTKRYGGTIGKCVVVEKEDLDLANHLIGLKQKYIKLSFSNQTDSIKVRRDILKEVRKNREKIDENSCYTEMLTETLIDVQACTSRGKSEPMENIIDIREYDVPYHVRVSIDLKIFCGSWYTVKCKGSQIDPPVITLRSDIIERPEPIVLAYDIETTKLPLKFPDATTDQIMMISYMIDGQGFLITNREILSADIEDFEYTPKPEFEGKFTIFNEPNEKELIVRFFEHIMDVRPHIFVTYNGDCFDWPFVETRAAVYDLDMKTEIGFSKNREGIYVCRPAMHMDCLCWVKRDSYLPVGSQSLKAVAKAKLRYDPVELDPEEMCPLAASAPQVLSNYSVSDAVATYYLYMQYVHPFIFALCTIIPCEPDEVLRKGSGTLCEALLMVEAFHANIIFPNKEETVLNKLTEDGHVLHQETYVGGHVEALESGVFRADIPCRFKLVPDAIDSLIAKIPHTLQHAIEVEEGVDMNKVLNLEEVKEEIMAKLIALKEQPMRLERPLIYHLDVGAMYPNIILTNRLQPCAMVNETICASCDFNKPGATCQRHMAWMWRAEYMPATRNEYHRIQQQLETEKFPPLVPGGPKRAFHQLSKQEQADLEKKRLLIYCRKVYKKQKVTRVEEKTTTICQKENSFYVDTVRAFRDRRYEYKGLSKKAKAAVTAAIKGGDASEIKSAKNREVLYDSLQLAHKCILNSFYGYVMRRGARWHSMEMAGIVCYTGAHIIMRAREIIERVGRPLELDTDGIWCVLPASFPENVVVHTSDEKKKKLIVSYPNAVLNSMVKEYFTNDQYHELVDPENLEYVKREENSIFFEVDGPYKAMVLPASKEEGKRLKKRYAVFNFDGSLAELKGFEIKRRGELQLIKNFQSSVFEGFLKGETLETCYAAVAQVADYWLDVLYSHGRNMPDSELFDLISENKSMSKKLEEYGGQKSTSISTAKRLAEFLGDQMVKDAGLACKYVIAKKPNGAPVTERAIPLAIFQAEESVQNHFLRKWLKDNSISSVDIRDILDWGYYIERLGGTIQKIITIPAAMQGIANPVPRVRHPDWLHKKMLEKNDNFKQRRITEMFSAAPKQSTGGTNSSEAMDIDDVEDFGQTTSSFRKTVAMVTKRKREDDYDNQLNKSWREVLGKPPPFGSTSDETAAWIAFHKKKWDYQAMQRHSRHQNKKKKSNSKSAVLDGYVGSIDDDRQGEDSKETNSPGQKVVAVAKKKKKENEYNEEELNKSWRDILGNPPAYGSTSEERDAWIRFQKKKWEFQAQQRYSVKNNQKNKSKGSLGVLRSGGMLGGFLQKSQRTLQTMPWQVLQVVETNTPGEFKLWALVQSELHLVKLRVPKVYYVNLKTPKVADEGDLFKKCNRILPRSRPVYNLYMYSVPEELYLKHAKDVFLDLSDPNVEGLYETQVSSMFRILMHVGAVCKLQRGAPSKDIYELEYLQMMKISKDTYIPKDSLKHIYFYQHKHPSKKQQMFGLFMTHVKKALVIVVDSVRTNLMPNLNNLYQAERIVKKEKNPDDDFLPPEGIAFEVRVETDLNLVYKLLQKALQNYKDEKRGPTLLVMQCTTSISSLSSSIPLLAEFPQTQIHIQDLDDLYNVMEWQKVGAKALIRNYLNSEKAIELTTEQCRYFHLPIGNMPADPALFGSDLFFARNLKQHNHILWCSPSDKPDLGGSQENDARLLAENQETASEICNKPGWYSTMCIELDIDCLAINTLLQAHHVTDIEGTSSVGAFDSTVATSLNDLVEGHQTSYDETTRCAEAFKILRSMASTWMRDISVYRNVYADFQVIHFYRWLRSPKALLYDPALLRTLQNLMKKLFLQLVAEFKRLGCTIIYANFNKIVICTKKRNVEDAVGNIEFVVASIRNKELFHSLEITVRQCWEQLVWLDTANYAGIQGKLPQNLQDVSVESQNEKEEEDDDGPSVMMNWNIAEQLPEKAGCRNSFKNVIAGYIDAIYQSLSSSKNKSMVAPALSQPYNGLSAHEDVAEYAKNLINGEISQTLFKITEKMNRILPPTPDGNFPALNYVKAICHVFDLDPAVSDAVYNLKSNLLRLIGVGEFSEKALWTDQTVSYVIPQIICKACNHCRDLDLGRDPFRSEHAWLCPLCSTPYDNSEIENLLLDIVSRKFLAYNLQDLQCKKCAQIKMEDLTKHCTCASDFKCLISKDDLVKLLKTFQILAGTFNMPTLKETMEHTLQII